MLYLFRQKSSYYWFNGDSMANFTGSHRRFITDVGC